MLRKLMKTSLNRFSRLDQYYYVQPKQMAVIFYNINKFWTHKDIHLNAKGLGRGLQSLNFIKNDSILVLLSNEYALQKLIIKLAASSLSTKVFVSKASNQQQLQKQINQTNARAFIFDSFGRIGDTTVIDALYHLVPQIVLAKNSKQLMSKNFEFLRFLIQTDNYVYPGTYHLKKLIKYENQQNYDLHFISDDQPVQIQKLRDIQRPIAITDPCQQLAFKAGVLNCTVNGKLLYCIDPSQAKQLSMKYQHKIDFICTEKMTQLHHQNRVIVRSGSNLYEGHPQRKQIIL